MRITHIGHAGFLVETDQIVVATDPWLSPDGGIDAGWYQYPRNHHLADFVRERLRDDGDGRRRYVYVSHEHKDHFDPPFLYSLPPDFTYLVPRFRRDAMRRALVDFPCRDVVALGDDEPFEVPGGEIKLFLADGELNRDSALLVVAGGRSFLNVNDCKIHDRLAGIAAADGPIDVFTAQFSGATFHPTCYDYPSERYERISLRKIMGKFETVAQAIRDTGCRVYVPSAGPPCFLEPGYIERNFQRVNIFKRAPEFFRFLDRRLEGEDARRIEMMPGDVLDAATGDVVERGSERVDEADFEPYVRAYAADYVDYFAERERAAAASDAAAVFAGLREELRQKLKGLTLRERVPLPLYFGLTDRPELLLEVDFAAGTVEEVDEQRPGDYYRIEAHSWDVGKILSGALTWEDFMGTFRMRLSRDPDVYNTLVAGFLLVEAEDLPAFCEKQAAIEARQERCVVEAGGKRYEVDRLCPHLGGDLAGGMVEAERYLVCPRHHWRFDLAKGGRCAGNDASIHAVELED